jgi:hypothetical protein
MFSPYKLTRKKLSDENPNRAATVRERTTTDISRVIMPKQSFLGKGAVVREDRLELLQGTLDMLVMKTLAEVRCTATTSPTGSASCRPTSFASKKAPSIPRSTAWRIEAGSNLI